MLIQVPESIQIYPPGYADPNMQLYFGIDGPGLSGLGDCVTDPESGLVDCTGSGDFTAPTLTNPAVTDPMTGITYTIQGTPSTPASTSSAAADAAAAIAAANAATTAIAKFVGPSVVTGTNLVYNPATGQLTNAAGVTVGAVGSAIANATTPAAMASYVPLVLLAAAAFFLFRRH
jgi:hypothetical protein